MPNNSKKPFSSFQAVRYKDWIIKASTYDGNICVVMMNVFNKSTIINYFDDQEQASSYIEYWVERHGA